MAVTQVLRKFTWLEPNSEGIVNYKQSWEVHTDNREDGVITVAQATGLPQAGDYYQWGSEIDYRALCDPIPDIRLANQDHAQERIWALIFNFTNERRKEKPEKKDNPVDEPWTYESTSDEWEEETTFAHDINGDGPVAMMNSVLESFSHPVTKNRGKLSLSRNYASINQFWILHARESVNLNPITIMGITYGARVLFMRELSFSRAYSGGSGGTGSYYFPVNFELDVDPNTHDFIIPNKGWRKRRPGHVGPIKKIEETVLIAGGDGKPLAEPVYLDADGDPIEPDANGNITPVYRRYRKYREFDYSVFGFPT